MHWPAPSSRLMLWSPLWKTQPNGVLSPTSSGAQQTTPHHQASSPARLFNTLQGGGWLGFRAGDGPSQRELLCAAAASGGARQPAWQPACSEGTIRSPWAAAALAQLPPLSRPAAAAVGQPLWLAFLAACWAALGEGRGLTLGPQSECAAPCRDPGDENSSQ